MWEIWALMGQRRTRIRDTPASFGRERGWLGFMWRWDVEETEGRQKWRQGGRRMRTEATLYLQACGIRLHCTANTNSCVRRRPKCSGEKGGPGTRALAVGRFSLLLALCRGKPVSACTCLLVWEWGGQKIGFLGNITRVQVWMRSNWGSC